MYLEVALINNVYLIYVMYNLYIIRIQLFSSRFHEYYLYGSLRYIIACPFIRRWTSSGIILPSRIYILSPCPYIFCDT